jgi:uncharacterized protein
MATIRFHGALNDFLPLRWRNSWFSLPFKGKPAIKDAIEALGVPHAEIDAILVNQMPVTFQYGVLSEDQVEVFPVSYRHQFPGWVFLQPDLPKEIRFVLDVHLGKLARNLRMLGFDSVYERTYRDQTITQIAAAENRIVLTRDVGLLKQNAVKWGYWLRSQHPETQLTEVIRYFHLENKLQPFTRCLECNGTIREISKESVLEYLPPKTRQFFNEFYQCENCRRVYWKGSHFERMETFIRNF